MRGSALQLVNAVEDSNGFDAWGNLNTALEPTSKAQGLALLGAAATCPVFSMHAQHFLCTVLYKLNFLSLKRYLVRLSRQERQFKKS